jgi:hypothetical protein
VISLRSTELMSRGERFFALRAPGWLTLGATPTFVFMSMLTGLGEGHDMSMSCSAASHTVLSGMGLMYVLMSAFHFGPWLKLVCRRRSEARSARFAHQKYQPTFAETCDQSN